MVEEGSPTQVALDQLAEALAGSKFRSALIQDPEKAATDKKIAVGDLPEGLLATLGTMTDEELKLVSLVQRQLNGELRSSSVSILF